jgi:hypothetical protein
MAATVTDMLIIALLTGAIAYGYYVSRKVHVLMGALKDLEPLINEYSQAVDKSEASVAAMKQNLEERPMFADLEEDDDEPMFATRRQPRHKIPGVQVVRDKQDLVRRFFEASRTEQA